eukprot:TRINITY_DN111491_c0_g1_i1.p1 TRINITY_DN111491_c0_g1~~TRINITY_DN111491_c0_g1_i1.p1  ORF type:complete len:575 (+),score=59.40 TRINITY_DN111491_c0_g1_i1:77-1726(+)
MATPGISAVSAPPSPAEPTHFLPTRRPATMLDMMPTTSSSSMPATSSVTASHAEATRRIAGLAAAAAVLVGRHCAATWRQRRLTIGKGCRGQSLVRCNVSVAADGLSGETGGSSSSSNPLGARPTRQSYQEMKRESLFDAGIVGLLGGAFAFANSSYGNGLASAEGVLLGACAGVVYLLLLQLDCDTWKRWEDESKPLDPLRPLRIARLLVPVFLIAVLALQAALDAASLEAWLDNVKWEPGVNFTGVVSSPAMLYGAVVGYLASLLPLRLRALGRAVPDLLPNWTKVVPGSVGFAARFAEERTGEQQVVAVEEQVPVRQIPVLLVSGPRGCGKSTLVKRLCEDDARFREPEWVVTAEGYSVSAGRRVIPENDFALLAESGEMAVNFKPYGADGEEVRVGLPSFSVLDAVNGHPDGACIIDADPFMARSLLSYNWEEMLPKWASAHNEEGNERIELRLITVWVSTPSFDVLVERNRKSLMESESGLDSAEGKEAVGQQLKALRNQATADTEWALTSGSFDFTVVNADGNVGKAFDEVKRAATYCFSDPF